jgi:hypothetical protein
MDLAPQWGPEKMDEEIDPGWGGLNPHPTSALGLLSSSSSHSHSGSLVK